LDKGKRMMVGMGWVYGKMGNWLMGTEFQFEKMKKFRS
jgi:hypothetical protein